VDSEQPELQLGWILTPTAAWTYRVEGACMDVEAGQPGGRGREVLGQTRRALFWGKQLQENSYKNLHASFYFAAFVGPN
jgi:hypothetical protein